MTTDCTGRGVSTTHPVPFLDALAEAALDRRPVAGWTHNFYRYPARFSPRFAATAIAQFSRPGDVILDPYMGGGTAIVEGIVAGRHMIGNDINSLATFVAKVKTTHLNESEVETLRSWILHDTPRFSYRLPSSQMVNWIEPEKTKNLSLYRARFIKKATAAALESIMKLPSKNARDFAKCALLRTCHMCGVVIDPLMDRGFSQFP